MTRPVSSRTCGTHREDSFSQERLSARAYIARHQQVVAPSTVPSYFNKVILHGSGKGMWVHTIDGKRVLIADSDLGVSALGYNHPKLIEFRRMNPHLFDPADAPGRYFLMRNVNAGWRKYEELSQDILSRMLIGLAYPDDSPEAHMVIYDLGGGPLVEKVKRFLLRIRPVANRFIVCEGAFHGRFVPEFTRSNPIQEEYALPLGIAIEIPYPKSSEDVARALEILMRKPKNNINAVLLEGVQGEGGMNEADTHAMQCLVGALGQEMPRIKVVFDEIQTFTRTGGWFSFEEYGLNPDIVLIGKALGGGEAISAAIVPKKKLPFGWHGGTFPGYPGPVAQAIVTLDIIKQERLMENARKMGSYLGDRLGLLVDDAVYGYPSGSSFCTLLLKGRGLMRGIGFRAMGGASYPEWRDETLKALIRDCVFTTAAGHPRINPAIRIMPALNVDKDTIDFLVEKLTRAVKVGFERAEKKRKKS